MPEARSINQNTAGKPLPDFRNLGTMLRIVLLVNGLALLSALAQSASLNDLNEKLLHGSAMLQPMLLAGLMVLYVVSPVLAKLSYERAVALIVAIAALAALSVDVLVARFIIFPEGENDFRYFAHALTAICLVLLFMSYYRLRSQALSPAYHEARLQALQSRIRPHFLFNTINAVLGIVRAHPKRAEAALEDMADLFRMAMRDPQELSPLSKEIELARQYLAIEELRLGDRLKVHWDLQHMPLDVLIPPLMLQPLLENAVYHGIEPLTEGGVIDVRLYSADGDLHLEVSNPYREKTSPHTSGNKMALSNIRERLSLLFDVEAEYQVSRAQGQYHVHIRIPCVQGGADD